MASPPTTARQEMMAQPRRTRIALMGVLLIVIAIAVSLIVRSTARTSSPANLTAGTRQGAAFTRVGQNGAVYTISVPRGAAQDDENLMRAAEQLSAEEIGAGRSGQISVMVWPDDVAVPREPPTTEFDASMKTQVAGIFINPKLNIKHLIRFRDGATVAERDFGKPTR